MKMSQPIFEGFPCASQLDRQTVLLHQAVDKTFHQLGLRPAVYFFATPGLAFFMAIKMGATTSSGTAAGRSVLMARKASLMDAKSRSRPK
jgi:hypothetical protein